MNTTLVLKELTSTRSPFVSVTLYLRLVHYRSFFLGKRSDRAFHWTNYLQTHAHTLTEDTFANARYAYIQTRVLPSRIKDRSLFFLFFFFPFNARRRVSVRSATDRSLRFFSIFILFMYIHESWLPRRRSIYGKMRANTTKSVYLGLVKIQSPLSPIE